MTVYFVLAKCFDSPFEKVVGRLIGVESVVRMLAVISVASVALTLICMITSLGLFAFADMDSRFENFTVHGCAEFFHLELTCKP